MVFLRSKSPTSPVREELNSRPLRFFAFTYKHRKKGRGMRRTKVRRMRRWDVRYLGPGSTKARRHRPLSPHHSQIRQSRPPSRRHRGLRRGRKKVGHWCLGKLRVRMRTLMGRRIESRTWEIRVCPVGPFPCAFWASFEFWMMMRMRWDVLVLSSWFRAGF